jgi:hypothetical protein
MCLCVCASIFFVFDFNCELCRGLAMNIFPEYGHIYVCVCVCMCVCECEYMYVCAKWYISLTS